jgi:hypothetical protein
MSNGGAAGKPKCFRRYGRVTRRRMYRRGEDGETAALSRTTMVSVAPVTVRETCVVLAFVGIRLTEHAQVRSDCVEDFLERDKRTAPRASAVWIFIAAE